MRSVFFFVTILRKRRVPVFEFVSSQSDLYPQIGAVYESWATACDSSSAVKTQTQFLDTTVQAVTTVKTCVPVCPAYPSSIRFKPVIPTTARYFAGAL